MIGVLIAVLGPEIKLLLAALAIVGPVAIIILILLIKRIERENPDRIRWR